MSYDINSAVLIGRLTKDPETRTAGQTIVCDITIAVGGKPDKSGKDNASFFDVTAWGKLADFIGQYLTKGARVCISGRLEQQRWEKDGQKRSKIIIVADRVQALDGKPKADHDPDNGQQPGFYPESDEPLNVPGF
jgi:single-strand DNA-binding protein